MKSVYFFQKKENVTLYCYIPRNNYDLKTLCFFCMFRRNYLKQFIVSPD